MLTPFESIVMGHLVGDYLLQNTWMAQRKGSDIFPCIVHCLIYTAAVCAFTSLNPVWAMLVFLSHFPVDRLSLADKWLGLIRGRTLHGFYRDGHNGCPTCDGQESAENYRILRGGFSALVYAVADNTMHLLLMILGWRLLF